MSYCKVGLFQITIIIFFLGCSNSNSESPKGSTKKEGSDKVKQVNERTTFVKNKDASTFLGSWSNKNRIVYHVFSIPETVHPTNAYTSERSHINQYTQKTILENDIKSLQLVPGVVTKMPEISDDELKYEYTLRKDIFWDNGTPLTTEDILFTFKVILCPLVNNPQTKPLIERVKDIKVTDEYSFFIEMTEPHITAQHFLPNIPIMQREFHDSENVLGTYSLKQFKDKKLNIEQEKQLSAWATEFNKFENGTDPHLLNGLGAYKVKKWDTGQSITLEKKANHWTSKLEDPAIQETAYPQEIIFLQNRDPSSLLLEFKAQNIDVTTSIPPDVLLELQQDENFNKNYHSNFVENFNYSYMALNTKPEGTTRNPLFTEKKVRQAIAMLVPVDDIITIANKGVSRKAVGPVSSLKKDFNDKLKPIPYDLQKAKKLLQEIGWEDTDGDNILDKEINGKRTPFIFDLHYMNVMVQWQDVAKIIKENMADAGIKVEMRGVEPAVVMEKIKTHDFDAMLAAWSTPFSPDDLSQIWHTSSWANGGMNFAGFGTPESDALIDSMNTTTDVERYRHYCKIFQELVYDEQPYVFLNSGTSRIVIHKRFGNADMFHATPGVALNNLKLLSKETTPSEPTIQ